MAGDFRSQPGGNSKLLDFRNLPYLTGRICLSASTDTGVFLEEKALNLLQRHIAELLTVTMARAILSPR